MNNLFIVANWKSNKTLDEAKKWFDELDISQINLDGKEIIICPPFTLLSFLKEEIDKRNLPINLGAQDVSGFGSGSYTGEVSVEELREFTQYVIIGHSERRKNFHEDDSLLAQKVSMSLSSNLTPIFCVSSPDMFIPQGVSLVAYEPLSAIGTGNADNPENADEVAAQIKKNNKQMTTVLYGGSVTPENVKSFTEMENIDGVLVGGASLDASSFSEIVQNA